MLDLKFVPSANWASMPFQGPQIVLIDEQNRLGFWSGSDYELPGTSGAGLSVDNIDSLTSADGAIDVVVPGTQSGTPRVLRKATLRPSNWITSWTNLLAIASPQQGDVHYLATGVLGNLRPTRVIYDGTRWLPDGTVVWNLTGLVATRTTSGLFALTSGGSTNLCPVPANVLRNGSVFKGETVFIRTGAGTDSIPVRVLFGTTPSLVIGTDNMSGSATTEGRFIWSLMLKGGQDAYGTFFAGIGNNQPLCNTINSAQIDYTAAMAIGADINATPSSSTFELAMTVTLDV